MSHDMFNITGNEQSYIKVLILIQSITDGKLFTYGYIMLSVLLLCYSVLKYC